MTYIYGLFIALICVPLFSISTILTYKWRDTNAITRRGYLLLQIQSIGLTLAAILQASALMMWPVHNCRYYMWVTFLVYPLVLSPILFRCTMYCRSVFLARERRKPSPNLKVLERVRNMTTKELLLQFLYVSIFYVCIPLALTIVSYTSAPLPDIAETAQGCRWERRLEIVYSLYVLSAFAIVLIFVSVLFLRTAKDVYRIKQELLITLFTWTPLVVLQLISWINSGNFQVRTVLPDMFWMSMALFLINLNTFGQVLYQSSYEKRFSDKLAMDLNNFTSQLQSPQFREVFKDFLTLQLNVENLLFWEAVQTFKQSLHHRPEMVMENARVIYESYLKAQSPYEVNISFNIRHRIALQFSREIPDTAQIITDITAAEEEVVGLMKFHSYPLFCQYKKDNRMSSSVEAASISTGEMDSEISVV